MVSSRQPYTPKPGVWVGKVIEISGDWLFLDCRRDGQPDLFCEVQISRFNLGAAEVGSLVELDPAAQTVDLIDLGVWTKAEIDEIKVRAHERARQLRRNIH